MLAETQRVPYSPVTLTRGGVCQLVVLCGAMPSLWALCGLGLHEMSCHNCPHALFFSDCPYSLVI